jgi:hypothetical protein
MILEIFGWGILTLIVAILALAVFRGFKPQHRFSKAVNAFFRTPGIAMIGRLIRGIFIWGVAIICGIMLLVYWLTPEQERLSNQYRISQDKVVIEPKPHGCDFDDAPLGNKHCHYEKQVDVGRACGTPSCKVTGVYVSWRKVEE